MKKYSMKRIINKLLICSLAFSCNNKNSPSNIIEHKLDSSKIPLVKKEIEIGTVYISNDVKVMADTTIDKSKIYYACTKFEPYINFGDFKVNEIYKGKKIKIDYSSNSLAREYRTVITNGYAEGGVNFGGHYQFISWGCGAPCAFFALVDAMDGKVYDGFIAPLGFDFRKDSRMMIANPPDSTGFYDDCNYCHPEIWIWNETSKKFTELKPETR
jgi:hypothetical protein